MSTSKICHFLIGIPGSGKSTFAHALAKLGNYVIVSTDDIRIALYGDAKIQGNWSEVENQVIVLIGNAIASGKGVIYDATNCKRSFRLDFLMKLEPRNLIWIAWYLKTPIEICLKWNQQRDRQVPPEIIASMYKSLLNFPPLAAEGFAAVEEIDMTALQPGTEVVEQIERIQNLHCRIINRTQHNGITLKL